MFIVTPAIIPVEGISYTQVRFGETYVCVSVPAYFMNNFVGDLYLAIADGKAMNLRNRACFSSTSISDYSGLLFKKADLEVKAVR